MTAGYFMTKLRYFVWNMFHMLVQECLRFLISKAVLVSYYHSGIGCYRNFKYFRLYLLL